MKGRKWQRVLGCLAIEENLGIRKGFVDVNDSGIFTFLFLQKVSSINTHPTIFCFNRVCFLPIISSVVKNLCRSFALMYVGVFIYFGFKNSVVCVCMYNRSVLFLFVNMCVMCMNRLLCVYVCKY